MKWSGITWGSTLGMSIHGRSWCHKEPKVPHERNKCCAFSTWPQPAMQKLASVKIMSRFTRFDLVGNMSQSNLKQKLKPSKHLSYKKKHIFIQIKNIFRVTKTTPLLLLASPFLQDWKESEEWISFFSFKRTNRPLLWRMFLLNYLHLFPFSSIYFLPM